ncbi:cohesin domain-containing protein [Granulicella arctica]|uniref:cohesin domain-containing protein n=1 Tax=Granulicella arctica TaxID=940613 RepID=UPI0021E015F4|nr:cohesin domain-containing protein [Granulicella arctica]
MVPIIAVMAMLLVGDLTVSAKAQSAGTWFKRARNAETREDYDGAYEGYRQAFLKNPKDLRYKTGMERLRFQAAASHVDRGRVLRQNGDFTGAVTEFTRALLIDPGDQVAQQEIDITQRQQQAAPPGGTAEVVPKPNEMLSAIGSISGIIELKPVSNELITLHAVDDTKVIYQAIGKLAGLNVLFDPDYTSKRVPVDLTNVSLSDALRIVGTIAGTFYKPVTANTIFIAQNTRTKRTDLDEVAVQTFYLSNASQQADATEVLTAIRNLLDPSVKVYLVPSQNAIVMRATPDQLLLAQKLLNDLDRAKPEVIVDVAILEVNRDKVRTLGITLPQSIGLTPQVANSTSTTSTSTSSSSDGTTTPTTTSTGLTLNNLAHLNANNFGVTITGGTLNALLTDSDTRVLQNPKVRATDGQRATLKIGSKIPVATGSYNAGVSTGIASIGVQTQFTYLDVGVNIDMTPTVHYDHEISLKMKIEVSTQNGTVTISNVQEPIISQRVVDQTIQLKEGEPTILAGLLEKDDLRNLSGTPGLAELPLLKYLFGSQSKETKQDEVVFVLIPHIVRESVLTRLNTRAIDTGTGASVELRRDPNPRADADAYIEPSARPAGSGTSAANAASSMLLQLQQQSQRPANPADQLNPPATAKPPAAASGGPPVSLSVVPANSAQTVGSTFQVAVMLQQGRDVYSVPLQMQFDPKILDLVNVDAGDFLGHDGQAVALTHRDDGNGLVTVSTSRPPGVAGITGQGNVCTLTFKAKAAGDSTLTLVKVGAKNSAQANLPAVGSQAVVHVK